MEETWSNVFINCNKDIVENDFKIRKKFLKIKNDLEECKKTDQNCTKLEDDFKKISKMNDRTCLNQ